LDSARSRRAALSNPAVATTTANRNRHDILAADVPNEYTTRVDEHAARGSL
jgi:hypothetical protein